MRKVAILGAVGAMLLVLSFGVERAGAVAAGAPPAKVGYVDLQKTLETTKVGKAAAKDLETQKKARQKKLDKQKTDLDQAVEEFKKQAPVLKPDAAAKRRAELEEQALKYQESFMKFQQELLELEREATQKIFKKAAKVIESIAKRDGYTMIVEKNEGAVLWADSVFDITDEVNKRLDAGEGGK